MADFFKQVPMDYEGNLRYRAEILGKAQTSSTFRHYLRYACTEDVLFFFSAFVWLYEPRPMIVSGVKMPHIIPFIPWVHQIPIIQQMDKYLGVEDIGLEKSRGEGASWMSILFALRDWIFCPLSTIGLVSRNEIAVDNPDDPDSLMWKCLSIDTPIQTNRGVLPLSGIVVGDKVVGSSGNFIDVLGVVPPHDDDLLVVEFSDGTEVKCTGDHKFPVTQKFERQSIRRLYDPHKPKNVTVSEMAKHVRAKDGKHWNYQVQDSPVFAGEKKDLLVDPYVLGVLIGDGCLSKCSVEFASVDQEVVDRVDCRLGNEATVSNWKGIVWGIIDSDISLKGKMFAKVESLGLRGCRSWEKFIPVQYFEASVDQRLDLLRGLMDTDGTVSIQSSYPTYTTTSPQLASDVQRLARSLGAVSKVWSRKGSYRLDGKDRDCRREYRVSVSMMESPFYLSRKLKEWRPRKHSIGKRIVAVEPCGRGAVSCLKVDSEDSLFVIAGGILTHNCDWELTKLPPWMAGRKGIDYKRTLSDHTLKNNRNGSVITGYAATGDVASGGRKKYFLMDELAKFPRGPDYDAMASTQYVTNSRLVVSTPKGSAGAYYDLMHEPSSMVKLILDWKANPSRNRGLYTFVDNKPVALDPINNPLPANYSPPYKKILDLFSRLRKKGFKLHGTVRSPWFDHECDRPGATPQNIAQELGRDYGGSMYRIFGTDFFDKAQEAVRTPYFQGTLTYNTETLKPTWDFVDGGDFHLWCELDPRGLPPYHQYVLGIDVSTGLGGSYTSNSVCTVLDMNTGEQVMEFASNTTGVNDFADTCIAIAKWFHDGYLSWEINGPGAGFTTQVKKRGYGNVYMRQQHDNRGKKKGKSMGWWTDDKSKEVLFAEVMRAIRTGEYQPRSDMFVKECGQYVRIGGKIEHNLSINTKDDSSKGKAHGDRVIAFGVALQGVLDRPLPEPGSTAAFGGEPPEDTMAARDREYRNAQTDSADGWDDGYGAVTQEAEFGLSEENW